jgi:micrococcal nuclease
MTKFYPCAALSFLLALIFGVSPTAFADIRTVVRVVDGDTLVLDHGERLRLIGVDTPETKDPRRPVQYFGREASDFTKEMIEGRRVRVEFDQANAATGHKDRYGRTLGYVFRDEDGMFLNAEIIRQGFGHAYTRFPFKLAREFREHERDARSRNAGLWNDANGQEPKSSSIPVASRGAAVYTGPRGGVYHYSANGKKIYDATASR